jgi:hypothetical protein
MDDFFDRIDSLGINTTELSIFRQEFISGKTEFDFHQRLRIYLLGLSDLPKKRS